MHLCRDSFFHRLNLFIALSLTERSGEAVEQLAISRVMPLNEFSATVYENAYGRTSYVYIVLEGLTAADRGFVI